MKEKNKCRITRVRGAATRGRVVAVGVLTILAAILGLGEELLAVVQALLADPVPELKQYGS